MSSHRDPYPDRRSHARAGRASGRRGQGGALIRHALPAAIAAGVLMAQPLAAQRPFHQVRGVVTDVERAPVPGVEVLIAGGSRTATTDVLGTDCGPRGALRGRRQSGFVILWPRG